MKSKDFFHRKRLLPKRTPSSAPDARSSKPGPTSPEQAKATLNDAEDSTRTDLDEVLDSDGEAVAAVFDRPTIVPHVSPDILAARAMQQQAEAERATTTRAPRRQSEPCEDDENNSDLDSRVTLATDDVPFGEQALVHAHRSVHHAINPQPNPPIRKHVSSPSHVSATSIAHFDLSRAPRSSDPAESGASALGFVDSIPRTTGHPPALDESRKPNQPALAAKTQSLTDMYAVGNFSGALQEAERRLAVDPSDPEALRYAQDCRRVLVKMQLTRLGSLQQIVHLAVPAERLQWLSIDHRAGFLLSLVDGCSTLDDLLDICGMPRLEALHLFAELNDQGVILLKPLASRR